MPRNPGNHASLVFYPSFYPDGDRLAIMDLGAGGLNGGIVRMVDLAQATVASLTNQSEILAGMPAVSPDGQRVAFAGQRNLGQMYDETRNSVFILETDGTVTQPDPGLGRTPAWSPDGEWIAFESARASSDGRYAAFIMRPDGSGLRQLTDLSLDANHPVFSPAGRLLAFSASQPGWPETARGIAVIDVPDL
jgi:TolB protein